MQIAIWSKKANSGVTVTAISLATYIAAQYGYKTLLSHSFCQDLAMEYYVQKQEPTSIQIGESSLDSLLRLSKNGRLTTETVKDYCLSLLSHSNLDFMNSQRIYAADESFLNSYQFLLHLAGQYYDVSVIDLSRCIGQTMFDQVLTESEVSIEVVNQNQYQISQAVKQKTVQWQEAGQLPKPKQESVEKTAIPVMDRQKQILLVNRYDSKSTISKKQLLDKSGLQAQMQRPGKDGRILTAAYATELIDQSNRRQLVDYLLRQIHNLKKTDFSYYLKDIKKLAAYCLENKEA